MGRHLRYMGGCDDVTNVAEAPGYHVSQSLHTGTCDQTSSTFSMVMREQSQLHSGGANSMSMRVRLSSC